MSDKAAVDISHGNAVVIVAAGRGSRIGDDGEGPKQYRRIGDRTILARTLAAFLEHPEIHFVQVVIHPDDADQYAASAPEHAKLLPSVPGGKTRQQSCLAGLEALADRGISRVLVHDAARPFVGAELISGVLEGIEAGICALPATPVADTLKRASRAENGTLHVDETVPRDQLYAAQTPQGFIYAEIREAHIRARDQGRLELTDDAAVAENAGMQVRIVPGSEGNRKITTQEDLQKARERESMNMPDVRTGNGYDVHRLIPDDTGRGVILCGVEIAHSHRLDGHSDADVGLHALTDALLGTIGDGDIGSHFPPSDPQWKGASSDRFLSHACELVRSRKGTITHLDVMLICEAPKIGPHREAMRARIAKICQLDVGRISVKATTNEGIGFLGRGEGIAALANATVVMGT
jgi:2-C-methyl-D-erythritol 4-phosphate cytidylyltransferase/2-C-methyl-D-erythritol 2,4-cyclodiphosphate synthase